MNYSSVDEIINKKIGKGTDLDDIYNPLTGRISTNTSVERLNQSIKQILGTRLGERFFLPDFGSKLHLLLFERNTYIFQDLAELYIREALTTWEPRISILSVDVSSDVEGDIVPISITYAIANTNRTVNYVYPYVKSAKSLGGGGIE